MTAQLDRARSADARNEAAYAAALARVSDASREAGRARAEGAALGSGVQALMTMPTTDLKALTTHDLEAMHLGTRDSRAMLTRQTDARAPTSAKSEHVVDARLANLVRSTEQAVQRVLSAERNLADARAEASDTAARRVESARHLQALTNALKTHGAQA